MDYKYKTLTFCKHYREVSWPWNGLIVKTLKYVSVMTVQLGVVLQQIGVTTTDEQYWVHKDSFQCCRDKIKPSHPPPSPPSVWLGVVGVFASTSSNLAELLRWFWNSLAKISCLMQTIWSWPAFKCDLVIEICLCIFCESNQYILHTDSLASPSVISGCHECLHRRAQNSL